MIMKKRNKILQDRFNNSLPWQFYWLITSDDIIQVEGENAGEEGEASDDVHMEEAVDNDAEAGEEQEPDAEEMWNKMSDFPRN